MAEGELRELAETARHGEAGNRVTAQVFERAADEVAHVDEGDLRQGMQLRRRRLRGRTGRCRDMRDAGSARDIDAAMDRVYPRRTGVGDDDPRGAEDGEPADDAEPSVQGFRRQRLAAGDRYRDDQVGRHRVAGEFGECRGDHAAWTRIDRRFADGERQARPRHRADAGPRAHRTDHQRAVRNVGVIAGVLDDAGARLLGISLRECQAKTRLRAARQAERHRVREAPGQPSLIGGARSGRRARPGRPASAQHASWFG